MSSQDKARKAYQFFRKRSSSRTPFTVEDLMQVTNWTKSTVQTYISKQWREIIQRQPDGEFTVLPEIQRLSEEQFLQLATQKRQIFASYERVKYCEIAVAEVDCCNVAPSYG